MKADSCQTPWRGLVCLPLAASVAWLTGCLVIPTDYYAPGSRRNLSLSTTNLFVPGTTTKEDVFLALGEPDFASEDGQRLGYSWTKVKAIWVVASYGGGAGGEIDRSYVLETSFDASNRLSQVRLFKEWGSSVTPSREATPSP